MGIIGSLVATITQFLISVLYPNPPVLISPVWSSGKSNMTNVEYMKSPTPTPIVQNSLGLKEAVGKALEGSNGQYNIYIKYLPTGETFFQNENEVLPAGSLYKAWLAVGILDEIRLGELSDDKVLSESIEKLNEWAGLDPEEAELKEGVATFSVSEALEQMIGVSHNYAAYLLTRKIDSKKVQAILKDHGLLDSHYSRPPTVSAKDMGLFFEKVYRNEFFPDQTSQRLKDLLAGNKLNDGLPRFLPVGTRVEHKTGELGEYKHDCGIVYSDKGDYVICVMSKSNFPKGAEERTALVSKSVFDYFHEKSN